MIVLYVEGTVHPRVEQDPDFDGYYLSVKDLDRFTKELVGKSVYVEHMTDFPVGEVVEAKENYDSGLDVKLKLDMSNLLNKQLLKCLHDKKYEMLSLGHRVTEAKCPKTNKLKVVDKEPVEVSIVKKGDREGTHIYQWWIEEVNDFPTS